MRRSISDTLCLNEFDKGESDEKEADLKQEVQESILIMSIEFENGLLLQNDVVENIREIQKGKDGIEVNEEQTKDDGNQRTGKEEVMEQIAKNPKKEANELKERYKNILCRKKALILDDNAGKFRGISSFPHEIENLSTPLAFFNYFFDKELMSTIVDESNLFSTEKDASRPANLIEQDIRQFIGICVYVSLVHMPDVRSYWSPTLSFDKIRETMSYKKFVKIRRYLHFNRNSNMKPRNHPDHDRLHKLRPVIYTGDENNPKYRKPEEPDLGSSANIILRLCRNVPHNQNYRVYFDHFYASIQLAVHLAKCGILCLGTMRISRIPNCKRPSDKEMAKMKRGISQVFVAVIEGVEISSVVWKDNKMVTFISSFAEEIPLSHVKRVDKKENKSIDIPCPNLVKEYNRQMGVSI
ncbi:hypothetical protein NQ314_000833 [Rhamnusium bicolor]|uniref:PiggyBac transposable element-derived protein domain-containing protein n=1 Tax=Rhamnusium bicolor TaxID=1586634 RepID=A0AAV8ZU17_9CUCU|nr:hypothetical protein NQ314_000833 [Rhamnusium bicolor]